MLNGGPLLMAAVLLSVTPQDESREARADPTEISLDASLQAFVGDDEAVDRLLTAVDDTARDLTPRLAAVGPATEDQVTWLLRDRVLDNLEHKQGLGQQRGRGFAMDEDEIRRTVIGYEAFKIEAYVTSGVFPKRYFGYVDGKWDTAIHEYTLAQTTHTAVEVINRWLAEQGDPLRINDQEVAVTWVAEGGALLLGEDQDGMNQVHPVFGVGLDDIASGTDELAGLMADLDEAMGTDLSGIVRWQEDDSGDRVAMLHRYMTYEESIAGTALMWVWEKRIAQRKLKKAGRTLLHNRPLDEQFILGSLVYNSGLIHDEGRELMIRDLQCGPWLKASSDRNAHRRSELNLVRPADALAELLTGHGYRDQWTSWLAVYHVTQRYGGWLGLSRFTDVFDGAGSYDMDRWASWKEGWDLAGGADAARVEPQTLEEPVPVGSSAAIWPWFGGGVAASAIVIAVVSLWGRLRRGRLRRDLRAR